MGRRTWHAVRCLETLFQLNQVHFCERSIQTNTQNSESLLYLLFISGFSSGRALELCNLKLDKKNMRKNMKLKKIRNGIIEEIAFRNWNQERMDQFRPCWTLNFGFDMCLDQARFSKLNIRIDSFPNLLASFLRDLRAGFEQNIASALLFRPEACTSSKLLFSL